MTKLRKGISAVANSIGSAFLMVTTTVAAVYSFTDPNGPEAPARMLEKIADTLATGSNYAGETKFDDPLAKTMFRMAASALAPGMIIANIINPSNEKPVEPAAPKLQ